jgi:tRNA/tmRNA/rRNA uracil-C5-methylase (TrmA/RlmC/RlmD family)
MQPEQQHALNGIRNVKFLAGDASVLSPDLSCGFTRLRVVDPPRKGLEQQMLEEIKKSELNSG